MSASVLAALACTTTTAPPPTFVPDPTATTPPNYTKFTDESGTFSIQYPPEWDLLQSQIEAVDDFVADSFSDSDLDFSTTRTVFIAGEQIGVRLDPNVNIGIESLRQDLDVDEYTEAAVQGVLELFPTANITERSGAVVNGHSARFVVWEADALQVGGITANDVHIVQLYIVRPGDQIAWALSCTGFEPLVTGFRETCESVLKSFTLLK